MLKSLGKEIKVKIRVGEAMPRGYGFALANFYTNNGDDSREVFIIPLNWIFSWFRTM